MPLCMSFMTTGCSSPVGVDGLRLCFVKYEEEPADRGSAGLESVGGNVKSGRALYCMYDGDRLGVGVGCFETAGDNCDGGV